MPAKLKPGRAGDRIEVSAPGGELPRRGLIVEVTEGDTLVAGGNPLTQTVKSSHKTIALNLAAELLSYGVAAVAITPGFLRSESMLQNLGVTEATWRDAGKQDPNFL